MGLSPSQLGEYTHAQFVVKAKGFQNAKNQKEVVLRRMTKLLIAPHLSKKSKFNIDEAWPILSDDDKKQYRTEVLFTKEKISALMGALDAKK